MFGSLVVDGLQVICLVVFAYGTYQGNMMGYSLATMSVVSAVALVLMFEQHERAKNVEVFGYVLILALSLMSSVSGSIMFSNLSWVLAFFLGVINIPGIQHLRQLAGKE